MDVAIVGVGLHPFGRFGETTGIEMGAVAIRNALADAGVKWDDIQFAFAGSYEIDNPDAVVALLGLTGIPFTDVYNGCATAASALLAGGADTIRLGDHDLGIAVGMDKHPPGAFGADPRLYACPSWYGERRAVRHHQVLRHEDQQVHDRPRHLVVDVGEDRRRRTTATARSTRTRSDASRCRRTRSSTRRCSTTRSRSTCSAAPTKVRPRSCSARRRTRTSTPTRPIYLRASEVRTRRLGAFEVHSPWLPIDQTAGPTVDASRAAYETAGHRARGRRRDPAAGHRRRRRGDPPGRERLLRRRRAGGADRRRRHRDRRAAAGEHRRRAHRQRRAHRRVGPAPDPRGRAASSAARPATARSPAARRSATPSSTAPPAPPACRSCRSDAGPSG